jgi:hypothetical protein
VELLVVDVVVAVLVVMTRITDVTTVVDVDEEEADCVIVLTMVTGEGTPGRHNQYILRCHSSALYLQPTS